MHEHCTANHEPPRGEERIWAANRQLALSGIKGNVRALKFDGKDATIYHGWKNALSMEVAGLDVTAGEWLEILSIRTSHVALDVVKCAMKMGFKDPKTALAFVWSEYGEKFKRHPSAAKDVLFELQNFRRVRESDYIVFQEFALIC